MCKQGQTAEVVIDGAVIDVDECMVDVVNGLNCADYKTLGCCCGHGAHPMTVVLVCDRLNDGKPFEIFSMTPILRKRKFYKKDDEGMYYIPEVENNGSED